MWPFRKPPRYQANQADFWKYRSQKGILPWIQWLQKTIQAPYTPPPFPTPTPKQILKRTWQNPGDPETLCFLTQHPNGFIRQAALQKLPCIDPNLALPLLISRLNDWVPQVRQTAKTQLLALWTQAFEKPSSQDLLWELLPAFHQLSFGRRTQHQEILEKLHTLLAKEDGLPLLKASTSLLPPRISRWAITSLLDTGFRPKDPRPFLKHPDPVLRLRLTRKLWKDLSPDLQHQTLQDLFAAKPPFLRKESLYLWIQFFPEQSRAKLLQALEDPSGTIRGTARFYLDKEGFDIHNHLRHKALQQDHPLTWTAFAEVAKPQDRPLFESKLLSDHPQTRLAAYLYSLRQNDSDERILEGICNPIPKVAKSLQRMCLAQRRPLAVPLLRTRLRSPLPPSYRFPLLKLLDQQSTLACLAELLHPQIPKNLDPKELVLLGTIVDRLSTKASLTPTSEQLTRIEEGLSRLETTLPQDLQNDLKSLLQFWKALQ